MQDVRKIGLFDSGLGGLTVLKALDQVLPEVPKMYFGDTLHLPYGDKSNEAIIGYSTRIVEFLIREGCDMIVIACNSASAAAGGYLEEKFPTITFINVIDPVVQWLAESDYTEVGLFGTRATVRSGEYARRLQLLQPNIHLRSLSTPLLVPLIEDGFLGTGIDQQVMRHYMAHEQLQGVQALVPGCTHYPLLAELAKEVLQFADWIDAPAIVAETAAAMWKGNASPSRTDGRAAVQYFLSDKTTSFMEMSEKIFGISAQWQTITLS